MRVSFGGVEQAKEQCRDARGVRLLEEFWQDLRYGSRALLRAPGFTIVALLTLALGIAVTTVIFTVVDAVLLRNLPVNDPNRVVVIHNQMPKISLPRTQVSAPQYVDHCHQTDAFESAAAMTGRNRHTFLHERYSVHLKYRSLTTRAISNASV